MMIWVDQKYKLENENSINMNNTYISNKKILLGFWLYLMSDCIIFAVMFAVYEVLINHSYIAMYKQEIFDLSVVLLETIILLFSSFSFSMSMVNFLKNKNQLVIGWLINTFFLGLSFIFIECYDIFNLLVHNFTPQRSGFFSAYFTLIGLHGIHIVVALIWVLVMILQLIGMGCSNFLYTRMKCLGLFWHFLDIIWICIFTFVYLIGVIGCV